MSQPQEPKSQRQGSAELENSSSSSSVPPRRPPGACIQCKALKIRCEFIPEEDTCVRCRASGTECVFRGRKKRRPAPTQDELQQRSQSQNLQIQSLLQRLDETKARSKMHHCLAQAQAEAASLGRHAGDMFVSVPRGRSAAYPGSISGSSSAFGAPSNPGLLRPANYADEYAANHANRTSQPAILQSGLFSSRDVAALFDLYYDRLHTCFAILDPRLHTPQYLMSKSPLLFTMILAVASRHWQCRPKLHQLAMAYACEAVAQTLIDSCHCIETCQAYILMTVYPAPFQRWSENRNWLLIGAAVRISHYLRLDFPPPPELPERERLNRIRTWFHIMTADTSHCIQRGKTPVKPRKDYVDQIFDIWYRCSSLNSPYDIYSAAYLDIMQLVSPLLDDIRVDMSNPDIWQPDVLALVRECDHKISERVSHWQQRIMEHHTSANWAVRAERDTRLTLVTYCQRLTVLGAGVHWSLMKGITLAPDIFHSSVQIARAILSIHVEQLYPIGHLRYAIEPQYLHTTYSAAFLLNLLDPCFDSLVDPALRESILNDVRSLIRIWSSADVALDKLHYPFIYARFLLSLLDHYLEGRDTGPDGPSHVLPARSWAPEPRSADYDAGPTGYQTVFDANPAQFVEASHGGGAFAFQNFVTNVKTAQSGWQVSPVPSPPAELQQAWISAPWGGDAHLHLGTIPP
ncbi:uncharacterized protein B0H18DRAFT_984430 [Fomitopsis serialis]|uniref:uncharacterized protein n=1 Tax=Fomitopsis serialis TaxID=139415 RepID=UPI0020084980|nr:uncharacterized protein B0H18DRAFT_984430 [Neoantrodia serialis]KAH9932880.1 hypothetical protein B0H18DRAFT_984430 [Neoantrodia serialis]